MIIYYLETGEIHGISHLINADIAYPYIETDNPAADEMFNGTASPLHYKVINGELVPNIAPLIVSAAIIENRIYEIPIEVEGSPVDVRVVQKLSTKQVSVEVSQPAVEKCKELNLSYIVLTACTPGDPYSPQWTITIPITDNSVVYDVDYSGTDDIRFYTNKVFDQYYHEVK